MRLPFYSHGRLSPAPRSRVARWLRNDRGATAIEFAIVAVPFFMLVLGTIGIGLYFFTTNSLEHGVEAAARKIRTGEAQKSGLTVGDFKQSVCDGAGSYIDCSKLSVLVQHASSWSALTPQSCVELEERDCRVHGRFWGRDLRLHGGSQRNCARHALLSVGLGALI